MKKLLLAGVAGLAMVTGAQAADLAAPRMPIAGAVVAPAFSWTGFYVGANIGYAAMNVRNTGGAGFVTPSGNGFAAGAQLGFNYQVNNIVLGIEGDLGYLGISRTLPCGNPAFNCNSRMNWDASVRARLGIAIDRALLYVTGGLAIAEYRGFTSTGGVFFRDGSTRVGWTIGAGAEFAVSGNWTVRAEYLYANYGSRNMTYDVVYPNVRVETHKVRVGVNYLFSTGPSAVVARY